MEKFNAKKLTGARAGNEQEMTLRPVSHKRDLNYPSVPRKVTEVEASLEYQGRERPVPHGLVRKRYQREDEYRTAVAAYQKCKQAGLNVVPTFRVDDKQKSILMTNLNNRTIQTSDKEERPTAITLSHNETEPEQFAALPGAERFENFDSFLRSLALCALRAAQRGIRLPSDAYFFTITKTDKDAAKISYVVGDFERVQINVPPELSYTTAEHNLRFAMEALQDLLTDIEQEGKMPADVLSNYRRKVEAMSERDVFDIINER